MLNVRVLIGQPGIGKTHQIIQEMVAEPRKCVFALPRKELIDECVTRLAPAALKAGTLPVIRPIHGDCLPHGVSVFREIEEAPGVHENDEHVILLITHEGLMGADLDGFTGWHGYIDENPNALSSGTFAAPALAHYLEGVSDLVPVEGTEWSLVRLHEDAPTPRSIRKDTHLKGLTVFHKRARSSQGVLVDVASWADLKGSDRTVQWWSLWTPAEMAAFASVTIAGAGYFDSLGYKAALQWASDAVTFEPVMVQGRARSCPRILIHYFTRHRGSTTFWTGQDKGRCVGAVRAYLEGVHDLGYWAANSAIEWSFMRLAGEAVSPRKEGTNSLQHHTSCALIYSAKSTPDDGPILRAFGLTKRDVELAREREDIKQFVMRGAIRRPTFVGTYRVYLYSEDQAQALAEYLTAEGIGTVELVPLIEAGIMDVKRLTSGRPKQEQDARTKAEKDEQRRAADRARKRRERDRKRQERERQGQVCRRRQPKAEPVSPGVLAYRRRVRNGLTRGAYKSRYLWKPDLRSILDQKATQNRRGPISGQEGRDD